jgi:NitT/TauT family transport system permease protein
MRKRIFFFLVPAGVALVGLTAWWMFARYAGMPRYVLPSPADVLSEAWEERQVLLEAAGNTAVATALGFPLAVTVSAALSLLLSLSRRLRAGLFPFLMALQMTPIIVVAPILLIWFGAGLTSTVLVTFLVSFFPLVVNTTQGLISTDERLVELFKMSRASRWQEILLLRVPAALPYFFTGLRISAVLAPIGAVVGDFFAGNSAGGVGGLGFRTVIYSAQLKTPALFATAAICCLLGFVLVSAVNLAAWFCLHEWHDSYSKSDH